MNPLRISLALSLLLAACSSSSGTAGPPVTTDAGADGGAEVATTSDAGGSADVGTDTATTNDATGATETGVDAGLASGSASLTGAYGTAAIKPVVSAYWIGMPGNPAESGGGPFIYLFSAAVSCDELSNGSGWRARIAAGTQVLELIVGTTTISTPVPAAAHSAANAAEVNYSFGQTTAESRATSGTVTLTAYTPGASVDGTIDVTFPSGSAKGAFHAVYCAKGNEL
jgi:hypothetical protein